MSGNAELPGKKPRSIARRMFLGSLTMVGLASLVLWILISPPNSFHPMCTYTVNAQVTADVEISGKVRSSEVVYQNSRSRQWISIMNSAGCKQRYGNAHVYRLENDSVLIVPARLCYAAEKAFAASGHVDVLSTCTGKQARQDRAFFVDSASRPRKWRPAINGVDFRIVSMTATSTWRHPADDIETIAPNLLRAYFQRDRSRDIEWGDTPETVIDYHRRYDIKKHRPDGSFEFEVQYGRF
ncbi:hypothetical protein [Futiania mangrovi]|uniref:Uncharacterized protein n=1 Tax=Futiania mangrovi TaxID=2959716 RepID=A0A9J6PJ27_9PROT|nr:hypothetical protein [Futiania mangrovii]MCP1337816.1 hypothetical protein [Futiania mangrovii]